MSRHLPVDDVLPELLAALDARTAAVLVAPPGAGKTTRVPPALLGARWAGESRILMLEPRRVAARAAARRMAAERGEEVGQTVGYRVRMDAKVGPRTRIEVVTEGVYLRMVQDDPALDGVAAVIFDEIHERTLDGDLALALTLDARAGLCPEVRVIAMSATVDGAAVADLLEDAALIEAEGRAYPVETRYLGRDPAARIEMQVADAVCKALSTERGSVLAFLPGQAEIARTARALAERGLPGDVDLATLMGTQDARAQDAAIRPAPEGRRKVVLATAVAETSLTIEGVRVVVDSGLSRVPRYEPATGLTRLETVRVSRASADQRRGRAGRTEPGVCYRLWDAAQTRALVAETRPEILEADLAPLMLDLARWGVSDPEALRWRDAPPEAAVAEARALLERLGAVNADGRLTAEGRALASLPLHPRLAHMVHAAAGEGEAGLAALIAAILSEPGLGGRDTDLRHRIEAVLRDRGTHAQGARTQADRWAKAAGGRSEGRMDVTRAGWHLARAYSDRVALARPGRAGEFLLANGRGARVEETDALAREGALAVADVTGRAEAARIRLAAPLGAQDIARLFPDRIETVDEVAWGAREGRLRTARVTRYGALRLGEAPLAKPAPEAVAHALAEAIRDAGADALPWTAETRSWRDRVMFLRAGTAGDWPDLSDDGLLATLEDWLGAELARLRRPGDLTAGAFAQALKACLDWTQGQRLEAEAPAFLETPAGGRARIDYAAEAGPTAEVRVQELYGLDRHPAVGRARIPLVLALTSPAGRPIQVTRDLPAFWAGSWADVRKDMRGRYPKHDWPEDPANAAAHRGAKRRKP
ncbi:ATP-dependent helicase HrpB [Futiania mangrovi]|uniref:RNA helicase n=1 Tax=Futiania mangrovi TaxID=2959716 RepID=A0A9J6PI85_9PROT|nr:ATP-dependent helicase HrpB [Futiania mangrovii]MCP1337520.1 ATP-dependent helicase HrpB [Futiania mangrovii]